MSLTAYAAYYDHTVRRDSSSGGVFSLLAEQFDVVYGVAMTEDCYTAEFRRIDDGDIRSLRGSKYLQARLGNTFQAVKRDIADGKTVLFTGTPCQVNGLRTFLGKEAERVCCIDVVCHGVPSPALWREYLTYVETRCGRKAVGVNFRCKERRAAKNERLTPSETDSFMRMFLSDVCLRPSCYACQAKTDRRSDMTIADFWGVENVAPTMNDGKGTSLVLVRTPQGAALLDRVRDRLTIAEVPYEAAIQSNPSEYSSTARPDARGRFFDDMNAMTFEQLCALYAPSPKPSLLTRVKRRIRRVLKAFSKAPVRLRYGVNIRFR